MRSLSDAALALIRAIIGEVEWNCAQWTDEEVANFYFEDNPAMADDVEAAATGDAAALERVRFFGGIDD